MNLYCLHDSEPSRKRHDDGIHHNIYGGYFGWWAVRWFLLFGTFFSVLKKACFYKFIKKKIKLLILLKVKVRNEGIFQALIETNTYDFKYVSTPPFLLET